MVFDFSRPQKKKKKTFIRRLERARVFISIEKGIRSVHSYQTICDFLVLEMENFRNYVGHILKKKTNITFRR